MGKSEEIRETERRIPAALPADDDDPELVGCWVGDAWLCMVYVCEEGDDDK